MRLLVIGTGVIGTTYAWQLMQAGCEVTHYVRKGRKEMFDREGMKIECLDMRGSKGVETKVNYRPDFVDCLADMNQYDLILISVGSDQLVPVLELLKEKAGEADVLFLQNIRPGEEKLIEKYLDSSRYLFGYPFKAGGGKAGNIIRNVIFGNILTCTMLGEMDGRDSDRLNEIFRLMKKANMNPKKTNKIIPYIRSHYVWAAAVLGAYAKAGSYDKFSRDKEIIRESYVAMREAFGICRAEGIDPAKIMPTSLYYLPLSILVPFTKKLFSNEDMKRMFEGHISGSPDEMKSIYYDVLTEGEKYRIDMPVYKSFKSFLDRYLDRNTLA